MIGVVPRALGPSNYGTFSFLTFFFARIIQFMKLGTTSAFFTKLSARQRESTLLGFYFIILLAISALILLFIIFLMLFDLTEIFIPGQLPKFIYLAAGFSLLSLISNIVSRTNDALGLTISNEIVYITQGFLLTGLILVHDQLGWLNLNSYFLIHYLMQLYLIVFGVSIIVLSGKLHLGEMFHLTREKMVSYSKEFFTYSHPLFLNSMIVMIVEIADRWLLQKYGGSIQQGYYGLSLKIVTICFLFTSSLTPLFVRELSISHENNDYRRMRRLFNRNIPLFFFIASYFSIFISSNAESILVVFGGETYAHATSAVIVLAFYPMHQTYGQLSGAVFLATGRTSYLRNIGISTGILGLIAAIFLITPIGGMGLELGALGLAIKIVVIQFIAVNIQLWLNCRTLELSFRKYLSHQIIVPGTLVILAYISSTTISGRFENMILEFLLNGVFYTFLVAVILISYPRMVAMSRTDLFTQLASIRNRKI